MLTSLDRAARFTLRRVTDYATFVRRRGASSFEVALRGSGGHACHHSLSNRACTPQMLARNHPVAAGDAETSVPRAGGAILVPNVTSPAAAAPAAATGGVEPLSAKNLRPRALDISGCAARRPLSFRAH